MEAIFTGYKDRVAVCVIGRNCLAQDGVAREIAGVGPWGVAAAVGRIGFDDALRAVIGVLGHQTARLGNFDDQAAVVVPGVRVQTAAGDVPAIIDAENLVHIHPALLVVAERFVG